MQFLGMSNARINASSASGTFSLFSSLKWTFLDKGKPFASAFGRMIGFDNEHRLQSLSFAFLQRQPRPDSLYRAYVFTTRAGRIQLTPLRLIPFLTGRGIASNITASYKSRRICSSGFAVQSRSVHHRRQRGALRAEIYAWNTPPPLLILIVTFPVHCNCNKKDCKKKPATLAMNKIESSICPIE